jgi:dTMP kinase
VTIDALRPDLTLVLDVPAETGLARAARRRGAAAADRFEAEGHDFHRRLREAYRQIVSNNPDRCVLIDADADEQTVAARIWQVVQERFAELAPQRETVQL